MPRRFGVTGPLFHPDGRQVVGSLKSDRRQIVVLDLETGKEVARYQHPQQTEACSWRSDGRLLAVGCMDQRIYVWDHAKGRLQSKDRLQSVLEGHHGKGIRVSFTKAGALLISTGWDGTTRLWDPASGRQVARPGRRATSWPAAVMIVRRLS